MSNDIIPVVATTEEIIAPAATVTIVLSSTGPTAAQTLTITWGGTTQVFTVAVGDTPSPNDLPIKGAESLAEYAALLRERLAQNTILHSYWKLSLAGSTITLTQRILAPVVIAHASTLSNATVTSAGVTDITPGGGVLSAVLEVWTDTGDIATDQRLIQLHAPYNLTTAEAWMDCHAAFAALTPHLPTEASINPLVVTSLPNGEATTSIQKYYLRYGEKSGTPPTTTALLRSSTRRAVLGATSALSTYAASTSLRHNYRNRTGEYFAKPVTELQPDYMYWIPPTGATAVYLSCLITWSDGTQSTYLPYGTTPITVEAGRMYWFASGFTQLKLGTVSVPPGAEDGAFITGYTVTILRSDTISMIGKHSVDYILMPDVSWSPIYLMFSNGVGGCETIALRGKSTEKQVSTASTFARPRGEDWTPKDGDFAAFDAQSSTVIEANTAFYDYNTDNYLFHLLQLQIGDAWLIDLNRRRFVRCIVETGDAVYSQADETLLNIPFTIRTAISEKAINA